jgi:hypothetical protein
MDADTSTQLRVAGICFGGDWGQKRGGEGSGAVGQTPGAAWPFGGRDRHRNTPQSGGGAVWTCAGGGGMGGCLHAGPRAGGGEIKACVHAACCVGHCCHCTLAVCCWLQSRTRCHNVQQLPQREALPAEQLAMLQ